MAEQKDNRAAKQLGKIRGLHVKRLELLKQKAFMIQEIAELELVILSETIKHTGIIFEVNQKRVESESNDDKR